MTTLVVCHPDDEVLWFSSLLERVNKAVVVYSLAPGMDSWNAGRKAVETEYPLTNVEFWHYTESMCFQGGDWSAPKLNNMGMVLKKGGPLSAYDPNLYATNFNRLVSELEPVVRDSAAVVTHNPWGEYGHEDHVMMYHAVSCVARKLGKPLWYSNYVSDRSARLMSDYLTGKQKLFEWFPTNKSLAGSIQSLYETHNCWTWPFPEYAYPDLECMILDSNERVGESCLGASVPLNYIDVDGGHRTAQLASQQQGESRWTKKMPRWMYKWR